jgi:hypothetical protein
MTHNQLVESGLAEMYEISPETNDSLLSVYIGRVVRYKKYHPKHGTIVKTSDFIIKETQRDYTGREILRGYEVDRNTGKEVNSQSAKFGRPIKPEDVIVVK